jgi:sugar lactone lactonase YvrE
VAGDGSRGLSGNGGPALSASLDPDGIAFDSLGNYYIADNTTATDDPHNCNVRKVDTTGVITLVAGNGQCPSIGSGSDGDGGPATSAQFLPVAITVDTAGNLYIADFSLDRVRKVDTHGTITTVAGSISCQGVSSDGLSLGDGGAANQAFLCNVRGVTVDNNGNLFIADSGNFRVRKVDGNGIITTVAGDGDQSYTGSGNDGDGGPATSAHLSSAAATAIDATGNLYIADYDPGYGQWPSRIRKVDTNGIITTFAGTGVCGYSGDGGPATSAQICTPFSLAINAAGDLFIADYWSFRVRKVGASGIITTVAGTGQMGFSGDGGLARLAKLTPYSIAFDASGNLYIVDALNYRIREVTHP